MKVSNSSSIVVVGSSSQGWLCTFASVRSQTNGEFMWFSQNIIYYFRDILTKLFILDEHVFQISWVATSDTPQDEHQFPC